MNQFFSMNPADNLEGVDLGNGFTVQSKVKQKPNSTGGHFSIGYIAIDVDGKQYFLKAMDLSSAFQSSDPMRKIQSLTTSFNFERDLLKRCKKARMKKVICPVIDGYVNLQGQPGPYTQVHYIIFDLAQGDIRSIRNQMAEFDLAWVLRSLHHASVGISELHKNQVAHQDIKPSNLMQFDSNSFKISDLGRAFVTGIPVEHDNHLIPGDNTYAPVEAFYGMSISEFERRKLYDIYSLGGLIFYHILGVSPTAILRKKLVNEKLVLTNVWDQDLPILIKAFTKSVIELESALNGVPKDIAFELVRIAKELCNPDYEKRGHPSNLLYKNTDSHSLERYVSSFDLLARKAELRMTK